MAGLPSLSVFKSNVLRFIDRCGASDGVFDVVAWEASGENAIFGNRYEAFVLPP